MLNWQLGGIFNAGSSDNSNDYESTPSQNGNSLFDYVIVLMSSSVGKYNKAFWRGKRLIARISTKTGALNSNEDIGKKGHGCLIAW